MRVQPASFITWQQRRHVGMIPLNVHVTRHGGTATFSGCQEDPTHVEEALDSDEQRDN